MEDIILKLHNAVMCFVHDRVESYETARERGFTTAELLGNAALGIGALVVMWGFFRGTLFDSISKWILNQIGH